jgi:ssDNA thymidine ADP-ribosyltransferase, DarT
VTSLSTRYREPLFYVLPLRNLASVLARGLLSYNGVQRAGLAHVSIALGSVQGLRHRVWIQHGNTHRGLHDYVPLFFGLRSPMLAYNHAQQNDIVQIEVVSSVLDLPGVVVADGNAATQGLHQYGDDEVVVHVTTTPGELSCHYYRPSRQRLPRSSTGFHAGTHALDRLDWSAIRSDGWCADSEIRRRKQAEALIPDAIQLRYFTQLHVRGEWAAERALAVVKQAAARCEVAVSPSLYFSDEHKLWVIPHAMADTGPPPIWDNFDVDSAYETWLEFCSDTE